MEKQQLLLDAIQDLWTIKDLIEKAADLAMETSRKLDEANEQEIAIKLRMRIASRLGLFDSPPECVMAQLELLIDMVMENIDPETID